MIASDVVNSPGPSPGIVTTIGASSTYNYVASVNTQLRICASFPTGVGGLITVNGVGVIPGGNTGSTAQALIEVAKGQTATIATSNNTSLLLTARSIP